MKRVISALVGLAATTALLIGSPVEAEKRTLPYTVVDTGLNRCYGNAGHIACPGRGRAFFGQDAQYLGNQPAYRDNRDGTITDLNTGLIWQKKPKKLSTYWKDAAQYADSLDLAGHKDWRVPSIKELFSIADFRGNIRTMTPYLDTRYFGFQYPDTSTGSRIIDAQYWSSNRYLGTTMRGEQSAFGFNFADGRIKSYPIGPMRGRRRRGPSRYVRCVRGPSYGINDFVDNGDGTISDRATGLMWMKSDSGKPMNWQQALKYAETMEFAGHNDWRLPNVKELQSIVDYGRAPDAYSALKAGPAIDPIFYITETESWFWTGTTHIENSGGYYVCFGQGLSAWKWRGKLMNAHGAGAVRSDPKSGNPARWRKGKGPQGDQIRIYNYVRCVRGGTAKLTLNPPAGRLPSRGRSLRRRSHPGRLPARGRSIQRGSPRGHFIRRLDRNRDGKVSRSEFDGPPHHFRDFDRNRDGYISEREAPTGPPPRRRRGFPGQRRQPGLNRGSQR
ncbi:DUF1566 domain-containing protein [Thermodesulfobacteriota bacterium]